MEAALIPMAEAEGAEAVAVVAPHAAQAVVAEIAREVAQSVVPAIVVLVVALVAMAHRYKNT